MPESHQVIPAFLIIDMKRTSVIILTLCIGVSCFSQKHDNNWVMGYYESQEHPDLGGILFNFDGDSLTVSEIETDINFCKTNASISDYNGEFAFVTNGVKIFDSSYGIMENGDSLNAFGITLQSDYEDGMNFAQAAIAIPKPGFQEKYILFHQPVDWNEELSVHFPLLLYSEVKKVGVDDLGLVAGKNKVILQDTLLGGKMTMTRHGNGRDWWLITGKRDDYTNIFIPVLIDPDSISIKVPQNVEPNLNFEYGAVGQATFTPDGNKYIRHDVRLDPFSAIDIYDFDRCTGLFTHNVHFEIADTTGLTGGAAVSPDSKYLYLITRIRVYQYDLTADDIYATQDTIAEFDGHMGYFWPAVFGNAQLGPDGKIYFPPFTQDTIMHVIHTPGQPGELAHVEQHAIALPKLNKRTIPNFPNYRLGPLDGSPCDTLGLDNFPMAGFAHYAEGLTVYFSDNFYYRPESWEWDFGDGQGSTERNPIHEYALPGEYEVCLTVANENGEDTHCRWVVVDSLPPIVGAVEDLPGASVHLWPNPASNQLKIRLLGMTGTGGHRLQLYDMAGRKVKSWDLAAGQTEGVFWLGGVAEGLYIWELSGSGVARVPRQRLAVGKLMVKK